ncbi:MaoC family dehydratase [Roseovarius salinarum]|uniref:MaoC family dehydratase n=1 Tax=Roseovarius salinarum TaxID=1981892 RepID=UPI001E5C3382|nr:MaoC family dehydratase [Roseovarius salinarum]
MTFDPQTHWSHPVRAFEDFAVGEVFRAPSRTMTEGVFAAFQAASGDNHPIHYDRAYLARRGHRDLMAHGYQTLIQAAIGASPLAHQMGDALIGFIEQSSRFRAPVHCGDTLYPAFEITALTPGRTTGVMELAVTIHNQDGVLVADGVQKYLMALNILED